MRRYLPSSSFSISHAVPLLASSAKPTQPTTARTVRRRRGSLASQHLTPCRTCDREADCCRLGLVGGLVSSSHPSWQMLRGAGLRCRSAWFLRINTGCRIVAVQPVLLSLFRKVSRPRCSPWVYYFVRAGVSPFATLKSFLAFVLAPHQMLHPSNRLHFSPPIFSILSSRPQSARSPDGSTTHRTTSIRVAASDSCDNRLLSY